MRILYFLLGILFVTFMLFAIGGDIKYDSRGKELSDWAKNQVESEFSFFQDQKYSAQDVDDYYKALKAISSNSILRFQIIDRQVYSNYKDLDLSDSNLVTAYNTYLKFFNNMINIYDFEKNIDFIVSVSDSIILPADFTPKISLIVPVKKEGDIRNKFMILAPDHYIINEWARVYDDILEANKKYPWERKIERAFWRGSSTGGTYTRANWQDFPRVKIVELSSEYPALLDAKFTLLAQRDKNVVDAISAKYPIAMVVSQSDHVKYKIQISIDGSITSLSSELWRLLSNSIVLRQKSTNIKWFHSLFKDGEHYLSIEYDMSNLMDKIKWVLANDAESKKIAQNATDIVKREVTPDSLYLYWIQILNKYKNNQDFDLKTPTLDKAQRVE